MQPVYLSTTQAYPQNSSTARRKDNPAQLTVIGGSGAVVGSTLANGKKVMTALERVKILKGQNTQNIVKVLSKSRLAKFVNNPVGRKAVGAFAGLSALLAVFGSISEVSTAYKFLESQNPNA